VNTCRRGRISRSTIRAGGPRQPDRAAQRRPLDLPPQEPARQPELLAPENQLHGHQQGAEGQQSGHARNAGKRRHAGDPHRNQQRPEGALADGLVQLADGRLDLAIDRALELAQQRPQVLRRAWVFAWHRSPLARVRLSTSGAFGTAGEPTWLR
jgi:hypothetical protein